MQRRICFRKVGYQRSALIGEQHTHVEYKWKDEKKPQKHVHQGLVEAALDHGASLPMAVSPSEQSTARSW